MAEVIVGIDLGTSNCVVAHADGTGEVRTLADAAGYKIHPSVVSFLPSGGVVVGAEAKQRKVIDPQNTIYSTKRLIGRSFRSPEVQLAKARMPYQIREGVNQLPLISTRAGEFAIPEVSAVLLDHVRNVAAGALGAEVNQAVITVPASFNDAQRTATATAGAIAGITVVRVLNEPTAAALAYGHSRQLKQIIAVYDFGGGTFDITILRLDDQVYEVLGTAGDSFLGGDDLDERLVDRMVERFLAEQRIDLRNNEVAMMRLRAVAEQTKIELSRRQRAVVRVDEIAYGARGAPLNLQIEVTRDEFVAMVADLIQRTFPVCQDALKLAGLGVDGVDDIVLVGGTTKVPAVRDQAAKFFARAPRNDINPEEAVAIGAALQADSLQRILSRSARPSATTAVVGGYLEGGSGEPREQTATRPSYVDRPDDEESTAARPPVDPDLEEEEITSSGSPLQVQRESTSSLTNPVAPGRPPARGAAGGSPGMPPALRGRAPSVPPPLPPGPPRVSQPRIAAPVGVPVRDSLPAIDPDSQVQSMPTIERPMARPNAELGEDPSSAASTAQGMTFPADPAVTARGLVPQMPSSLAGQSLPAGLAAVGPGASPLSTTARGVAPAAPTMMIGAGLASAGPAGPQVRPSRPPPSSGAGGVPVSSGPQARTMFAQASGAASASGDERFPPPAPFAASNFGPIPGGNYAPPDPAGYGAPNPPGGGGYGAPNPPGGGGYGAPNPPGGGFGPPAPPGFAGNFGPIPGGYPAPPPPGPPAPGDAFSALPAAPSGGAHLRTPMPFAQPAVRRPGDEAPFFPPPGQRPGQPMGQPFAPPGSQLASQLATMQAMPAPVVLDVTPFGLGIVTVAGYCEELIRRNTRVPTEIRRSFSTSRDGQDVVRIVVCQGESRRIEGNVELGELVLADLPRKPRGETSIEVAFAIDASGILHVRARDALSGREQRASLNVIGTIPEGDVAASRDRMLQLRR